MRHLIILLFLPWATVAPAQNTWTLESCVDRALQENLSLKKGQINQDIQQSWLDQSRWDLLPNLNANAGYNVNFGRSVDPFSYDFVNQNIRSANSSISTQLVLFSGFRKMNSIKRNEFLLQAQESELQRLRDEIILGTLNAFLQALYAQEQVQIRQEQVQLSRSQTQRTKALLEAGSATRADELEAESQLALEEFNLIQARNTFQLALLNLQQIMELSPSADFEITVPATALETLPAPYQTGEVYAAALAINPQIKASEQRIQASEMDYRIARGNYAPRLSAAGSVSSGYSSNRQRIASSASATVPIGRTQTTNETVITDIQVHQFENTPFRDQYNENLNQTAGLTLSIPLFNGMNSREGVKRSRLNWESAQLDHEMAKKDLQKTVDQLVADQRASSLQFESAKKAREAMDESFIYTQEKSRLGMISQTDFHLARTQIAKARSEEVRARYDLIFKTRILDYYLGKPVY